MIRPIAHEQLRRVALLSGSVLALAGCGSATGPATTATISVASANVTSRVAASGTRSPQTPRSGIVGRAVRRRCSRLGSEVQSCPVDPVPATVEASRIPDGHEITARADGAGRFALDLRPGTYKLVAESVNDLLHAAPMVIRVRAHRFTRVQIGFLVRSPSPSSPGATGCRACPPPPPGP